MNGGYRSVFIRFNLVGLRLLDILEATIQICTGNRNNGVVSDVRIKHALSLVLSRNNLTRLFRQRRVCMIGRNHPNRVVVGALPRLACDLAILVPGDETALAALRLSVLLVD